MTDIVSTKSGSVVIGNKEIADIIHEFRILNPNYKVFYARAPQKDAVVEMVLAHGTESILKMITFCAWGNKQTYFPHVDSPYVMREKWGKLVDFYHREKQRYDKELEKPGFTDISKLARERRE